MMGSQKVRQRVLVILTFGVRRRDRRFQIPGRVPVTKARTRPRTPKTMFAICP